MKSIGDANKHVFIKLKVCGKLIQELTNEVQPLPHCKARLSTLVFIPNNNCACLKIERYLLYLKENRRHLLCIFVTGLTAVSDSISELVAEATPVLFNENKEALHRAVIWIQHQLGSRANLRENIMKSHSTQSKYTRNAKTVQQSVTDQCTDQCTNQCTDQGRKGTCLRCTVPTIGAMHKHTAAFQVQLLRDHDTTCHNYSYML